MTLNLCDHLLNQRLLPATMINAWYGENVVTDDTGNIIAFAATRGSSANRGIYVFEVDGHRNSYYNTVASNDDPNYTPTYKYLGASGTNRSTGTLVRVESDDGIFDYDTNDNVAVTVSGDGNWLAFVANFGLRRDAKIVVYNYVGGTWRRHSIIPNPRPRTGSSFGKKIAFDHDGKNLIVLDTTYLSQNSAFVMRGFRFKRGGDIVSLQEQIAEGQVYTVENTTNDLRGYTDAASLQVSNDGKTVAALASQPVDSQSTIHQALIWRISDGFEDENGNMQDVGVWIQEYKGDVGDSVPNSDYGPFAGSAALSRDGKTFVYAKRELNSNFSQSVFLVAYKKDPDYNLWNKTHSRLITGRLDITEVGGYETEGYLYTDLSPELYPYQLNGVVDERSGSSHFSTTVSEDGRYISIFGNNGVLTYEASTSSNAIILTGNVIRPLVPHLFPSDTKIVISADGSKIIVGNPRYNHGMVSIYDACNIVSIAEGEDQEEMSGVYFEYNSTSGEIEMYINLRNVPDTTPAFCSSRAVRVQIAIGRTSGSATRLFETVRVHTGTGESISIPECPSAPLMTKSSYDKLTGNAPLQSFTQEFNDAHQLSWRNLGNDTAHYIFLRVTNFASTPSSGEWFHTVPLGSYIPNEVLTLYPTPTVAPTTVAPTQAPLPPSVFNPSKLANIKTIFHYDQQGIIKTWHSNPALAFFNDLTSLKHGEGYIIISHEETTFPWNFWVAPNVGISTPDCSENAGRVYSLEYISGSWVMPSITHKVAFTSNDPSSNLQVLSGDALLTSPSDLSQTLPEDRTWSDVSNFELVEYQTHRVVRVNPEDGSVAELFNNKPEFTNDPDLDTSVFEINTVSRLDLWVRDKRFPQKITHFVVGCPINMSVQDIVTQPTCPPDGPVQIDCNDPITLEQCRAAYPSGDDCFGLEIEVISVPIFGVIDGANCITGYECQCEYDSSNLECPPVTPPTAPTITTTETPPTCEEQGYLSSPDECECVHAMYHCPNGEYVHVPFAPAPVTGINGCVTDCLCGPDPEFLDSNGIPTSCGLDEEPTDVECPMCDSPCETLECPTYNEKTGEELGMAVVDSTFPIGYTEVFDQETGLRISCECGPCDPLALESCEELYDDPAYRPPGMVQNEDGTWVTTTTVTPVTPNSPDEGFIGHGGGGSAGDIIPVAGIQDPGTPAVTTVLATPQPAPPSSTVNCQGRFNRQFCPDINCYSRVGYGYACQSLEPGEYIASSISQGSVNPCLELSNLGKDGFIVGVYDDDGCQIGCSCVDMDAIYNSDSNLWELPTTTPTPTSSTTPTPIDLSNPVNWQQELYTGHGYKIIDYRNGAIRIEGIDDKDNIASDTINPLSDPFYQEVTPRNLSYDRYDIDNRVFKWPRSISNTSDEHTAIDADGHSDFHDQNFAIFLNLDNGTVSTDTGSLGVVPNADPGYDPTNDLEYMFVGNDIDRLEGVNYYNNISELSNYDTGHLMRTNPSVPLILQRLNNTASGWWGKSVLQSSEYSRYTRVLANNLNGALKNLPLETEFNISIYVSFADLRYVPNTDSWTSSYIRGHWEPYPSDKRPISLHIYAKYPPEEYATFYQEESPNPCDGKYTHQEYGTSISTFKNDTTFWSTGIDTSIDNFFIFLHADATSSGYTNDTGGPVIWSLPEYYRGNFYKGQIITAQEPSASAPGSPLIQAGAQFLITDILMDAPFNTENRGPGLVLSCDLTAGDYQTVTPATTVPNTGGGLGGRPAPAPATYAAPQNLSFSNVSQSNATSYDNVLMMNFDFGNSQPPDNAELTHINIEIRKTVGDEPRNTSITIPLEGRDHPTGTNLQYGNSRIAIIASDSPLRSNSNQYLPLSASFNGKQAQVSLRALYNDGTGSILSERIYFPQLITLPGVAAVATQAPPPATQAPVTQAPATTQTPSSGGGGGGGGYGY